MDENKTLLERLLKSFKKQHGLDDLLSMSEHWDGYKRENAVHRLGELGNPIAIPKLLIRVNDWVPQVRTAAVNALSKLMTHENAKAFTVSLPNIYHLETCSRDNHQLFISDVISFLLDDNNVEHIKNAAFSDNPKLARIAIKICLDKSLLDKQELVEKSLLHTDVVVRKMASDLLDNFSGEILARFLKTAIKDAFMPIRREAFQIYLKEEPETGKKIAESFLFDRHIAIREIAINYLNRIGVNVNGIYTNAIKTNKEPISHIKFAILGMAYLGDKNTISMIQPKLESDSPSIRKASYQSLVSLLADEAKLLLITGLGDSSPSVAKESARLLNRQKINIPAKEISTATDINRYPHTVIVSLMAMRKTNKWERLIFLFHSMNLTNQFHRNDRDLISSELGRWNAEFNKSSVQPTKQQIQLVVDKYKGCQHLFSERQQHMVNFTFESIGAKY